MKSKLKLKKSTKIDDIKDLIIRKFHVDKANEGHQYCLKTKYKNEFIRLNGENMLLKEMQDKMIQQEGLCGSIKLQLAQDRIQSQHTQPHSHNATNEPIRSFEVKLYSRRIGASGVEHTINFGDEGMDINARKSPTKSLINRLTPIKHKLNTLIYFTDMIEVTEPIDCKNGKSMLMIDYRTTSKFERLNIRADKYVISKIREILIGHNVKKSDDIPSHIPRRRRSLF